jgi:hypothetical protein
MNVFSLHSLCSRTALWLLPIPLTTDQILTRGHRECKEKNREREVLK